jgi:cell wall-associated NlpC family hydrolase
MMELQDYMRLPFKELGRGLAGVDCWGLACLWYRDRYGIELPLYTEGYRTTQDELEIGALVRRERLAWAEIPLAEAQEGDMLILRMRGQPMHCGIVLEPPTFLHVHEGINVCRERWDSLKWRDRISGVYRHEARLGSGGGRK